MCIVTGDLRTPRTYESPYKMKERSTRHCRAVHNTSICVELNVCYDGAKRQSFCVRRDCWEALSVLCGPQTLLVEQISLLLHLQSYCLLILAHQALESYSPYVESQDLGRQSI